MNPLIVDDDENALDNDLNRKGTLAPSTQGKANVWDSEGFLSKLSNIQHPTETEIFGNIIAASEEPTSPISPLIRDYIETARMSRTSRMDTLHQSPVPSIIQTPAGEISSMRIAI